MIRTVFANNRYSTSIDSDYLKNREKGRREGDDVFCLFAHDTHTYTGRAFINKTLSDAGLDLSLVPTLAYFVLTLSINRLIV
jgi:hypothetical protein